MTKQPEAKRRRVCLVKSNESHDAEEMLESLVCLSVEKKAEILQYVTFYIRIVCALCMYT